MRIYSWKNVRHFASRCAANSVIVVFPPRNFTLPSFILQFYLFICVIRKVVQLVVYRLAIRNTELGAHFPPLRA